MSEQIVTPTDPAEGQVNPPEPTVDPTPAPAATPTPTPSRGEVTPMFKAGSEAAKAAASENGAADAKPATTRRAAPKTDAEKAKAAKAKEREAAAKAKEREKAAAAKAKEKAAAEKARAKAKADREKAAAKAKADRERARANRPVSNTQNRIDQLEGMKQARAIVADKKIVDPATEKPVKITRGNWKAIVDGTFDPANPPAEPVVSGKKGVMAALADVAQSTGNVVTQQINRVTRARINLIDLGEKPRWKVHCLAHNHEAVTGDRAIANYGMTYPWGWCPGCREIAGPDAEVGLPYPERPERVLKTC